MGALIRGVGEGEVAMLPRASADDFAWLGEVLERAVEDAPARRKFVGDALAALKWADEVSALPKIGGGESDEE
jgi:hypothetical protein